MTTATGRRPASIALAGALGLLCSATAARGQAPSNGDGWPGFRGPDVDGTVASRTFAADDDFALDVAWKRPIGSGYSGIAIGEGVVVTMFSDGEKDVVAAYEPSSGAERWRVPLGITYRGHDGSYDGPTSTPALHDGLAFALGPGGRFVAVDVDSGALAWSIDLPVELDAVTPIYGFATSPLIEDDTLILQIGAPRAAVAGFDPATGRLRWTAGDDTITYQSPVPMTVGGRRQLVAIGMSEIFGIDPATGELLWSVEHGGSGFLGAESLVPVPAGEDRVFLAFKDQASTMLSLRPGERGRRLWENRNIRNSYSVAVHHGGHVYGFSSRFLAAVDADTGASVWKSRPPGDGFPMVVGDRLVILTKEGSLHVIAADPDGYRELTAVQVFEEIAWTPPSFALGSVFARSMGALARIDVRPGARRAEVPMYDEGLPPADSAFAAFLERLAAADDKAATIDRYVGQQSGFPIVEGDDLVHFVYRGQGNDLALAGDLLGSRQEARMHRVEGTDLFHYSARLEPDARINYRFIRDYEEIVDPRNERTTVSEFYGADMELSFDGSVSPMSWLAMPAWQPPAHLEEPESDVARGSIVDVAFDSSVLGEQRTLQVYIPPGYQEGDARYPVAYYHGGFVALPLGELHRSLDNLIAAGRIEPIIAVFLGRPPDLGFSIPNLDAYDAYGRMWSREVVPLIDARFRTVPAPAARASIGGGGFGYVAAYAAFRYPGTVGKLGLQSPAYNDWRRLALYALIDANEQPLDIYHEWGSHDAHNPQENWDNRDKNRRLASFLRQHGYVPVGGQVHDGTGWSSWKNRTDRVLQTLFPPDNP